MPLGACCTGEIRNISAGECVVACWVSDIGNYHSNAGGRWAIRRLARKREESAMVSEMEARGSKTLLAGEAMREPSWLVWTLMKCSRVIVLTVLWAGLGMGVGLFCGIIGVAAWSAITQRTPDMSMAYRNISIPLAICCGSCAFAWNVVRTLQAAAKRRAAK